MPDNFFGGQGATLLTAIVIVAVALLALVGVFWLIRKRASSTFIRGGKNRLPRLAVLDATAVDTRRRLVLIRRDDVEHLVMIGGPTDIVIESGINQPPAQRPAQPASPPQQRTEPPAPAPAPAAPPKPRAPAAPPQRPAEPVAERPRQPAAATAQPPLSPQPATVAAAAATAGSIRSEAADVLDTARTRVFEDPGFDASLLDELTAVPPARAQPAPAALSPAAAPSRPQAPVQEGPAPTAEPAPDSIRSEAADALASARTRVFQEPTFDDSDFDELTAALEPVEPANEPARPAPAPSSPPPAAAHGPRAAAAGADFEAVLAAELSEGLTQGTSEGSFIAAQYTEHQLDPDEAEMIETPEVKPEPTPSRDSLEAEMERLLGDLSRKP